MLKRLRTKEERKGEITKHKTIDFDVDKGGGKGTGRPRTLLIPIGRNIRNNSRNKTDAMENSRSFR